VVRIGESKPAVVFRLAASPNAWSKAVGPKTPPMSSRESAYQDFFQGVMDELREKYKFTNAKKAQPQSWYAFTSGAVSGITYNATFASRDRLRAEVYIDVGEMALNKAIYDTLLAQRTEIEAQTGELAWERLDGRRACRIALVRTNATIDDVSQQGEAMRTWLVQALLTLKSSFGPRLVRAVDSARQTVSEELVESAK